MTALLCQIATLGPLGRLPAPGTAGSLAALLLGWVILVHAGWLWLFLAALAATIIGVLAGDRYARSSGRHDPGEVIIDEVAGQLLAMLCIGGPEIGWFLASFILFRFFDISKIWPVSAAERLPGGIGIMADDIVAGTLAGLCLLLGRLALGS